MKVDNERITETKKVFKSLQKDDNDTQHVYDIFHLNITIHRLTGQDFTI